MIRSFRHQGLRRLFEEGTRKGVNPALAGHIVRLLDRLDAAGAIQDMNLPGFGLHQLKGDRPGTWGVRISENWRITFHFESGDAFDVDLEDYH